MPSQSKIPYGDTTVPYTRSKGEIEIMLRKFGAKGVQWREMFDNVTPPVLEFIMDIELEGVKRTLGFRLTAPLLSVKRKGRISHHINATYRLLWWYLKAKIEAVSYGLETLEKEFLSQVMTSLPDGSVSTVGENARRVIAQPSSDYVLPHFEILPPKKLKEEAAA